MVVELLVALVHQVVEGHLVALVLLEGGELLAALEHLEVVVLLEALELQVEAGHLVA